MRELKDYFCTETQSKKLKELGLNTPTIADYNKAYHGLIQTDHNFKHFIDLSNNCVAAPLRSQALDFFRDKGYVFNSCLTTNEGKYAYDTLSHQADYLTASFETPNDCENELINVLIELESEAQHENK